MKNKKKTTARYLKYVVKAPVLFYIYLLAFMIFFGVLTNAISVERRISYSAIADKEQIFVVNEKEIEFLENKVYAYTDKNQAVITMLVRSTEFSDGTMRLILEHEQEQLAGAVTVEVVTEKTTLFREIFSKVGR